MLRVLNLEDTDVGHDSQRGSRFLPALRSLDLSNTRLHAFPASLSSLVNLVHLLATGNAHLDPVTGQCHAVQWSNLKSLELLDLKGCKGADLMRLQWLRALRALRRCKLAGGRAVVAARDGHTMWCTAPPTFLLELRHDVVQEHGVDLRWRATADDAGHFDERDVPHLAEVGMHLFKLHDVFQVVLDWRHATRRARVCF